MKQKLYLLSVIFSFLTQYNFLSAQWTYLPPMTEDKYYMGAAEHNGKVYFALGFSYSAGFRSSNIIEVYDLNSNTHSAVRTVGGRGEPMVAIVGEKMYVGGGTSIQGEEFSNIEVYSLPNLELIDIIALPKARAAGAVVTVGKKIIFAGGHECSGIIFNPCTPLDDVDIYDTETDTWTSLKLSVPRGGLTGLVMGKYAVFAGGGANYVLSMISDRVDILDTETLTWDTASLSMPREWLAATSLGKYLVFGGGIDNMGGLSNVLDIWDSETDTWTTSRLSEGRAELQAVSVGDKAYFIGGASAIDLRTLNYTRSSNRVDILDTRTMKWSATSTLDPRAGLNVIASGNKIVAAGGYNTFTGSFLRSAEVFTDSTLSATKDYLEGKTPVQLFPNPAQDRVWIRLPEGFEDEEISLLNITGGLATAPVKLSKPTKGIPIEINLEGVNPGLYFYRITKENHHAISGKLLVLDFR
jgi:kelch-like protein 20